MEHQTSWSQCVHAPVNSRREAVPSPAFSVLERVDCMSSTRPARIQEKLQLSASSCSWASCGEDRAAANSAQVLHSGSPGPLAHARTQAFAKSAFQVQLLASCQGFNRFCRPTPRAHVCVAQPQAASRPWATQKKFHEVPRLERE